MFTIGEGVWGRGWCEIGRDRRLADDGKRSEVYGTEWTVHLELKKRKEEGVWGRRSSNVPPYRRLADDGKRLGLSESALDVGYSVPEGIITAVSIIK